MKLSRNFFNRPTVLVAKELLGKYLVRKIPSTHSIPQGGEPVESTGSGQAARIIKAKITETEAYCGTKDLACHASKGLTPRTKVMFGPPGHAYIYMIYGMYHCLNFVTEEKGNPSAVLIRGVEIVDGLPRSELSTQEFAAKSHSKVLLRGPGILCRELKIDRKLNNADLIKNNKLWVEEGEKIKPSQIKKGKRIGVNYAGEWKNKLWRFWVD